MSSPIAYALLVIQQGDEMAAWGTMLDDFDTVARGEGCERVLNGTWQFELPVAFHRMHAALRTVQGAGAEYKIGFSREPIAFTSPKALKGTKFP